MRHNAASIWEELCTAGPSISGAQSLSTDGSLISARWTQRDVLGGRKRTYATTHAKIGETYIATPAVEERVTTSFTEQERTVKFSKQENGNTVVEIWSTSSLIATWEVAKTIHGVVFDDEWFSGVAWSPDFTMFIYVADRPKSTTATHIANGGDDSKKVESWLQRSRAQYADDARDSLGEGYTGCRSPALYVADVRAKESRALCDGDADVEESERHDLYGDPQWSSDGQIICVTRRPTAMKSPALEEDGLADNVHTLGVRYCYNRYVSIEAFVAPKCLEDASTCLDTLTPVSDHKDTADFCCYSPRFTPDAKQLFYLSAPRIDGGRTVNVCRPHNTGKMLRKASVFENDGYVETKPPVTVVGTVDMPKGDQFPGLYVHALPKRPWIIDRESLTVVCTSTWGSHNRVIGIKVDHTPGSVHDLTPKFASLSCVPSVSVLDVCQDAQHVLLNVSSPIHVPRIFLGNLTKLHETIAVTQPSERALEVEKVATPFQVTDLTLATSEIDAAVPAIPHTASHGVSDRYQVTLLVPTVASPAEPVPLVVYPHGGPHSVSPNTYATGTAALLTTGVAVMYVNYRGSLGFGQKALLSLPGRAGTQDVAEVLQATRWAMNDDAIDETRVAYVGGSHGGFLGAHCSAVRNTPFRAVCLRNPVVNVASMANVTDIPEWSFCEADASPFGDTSAVSLAADPSAMRKMWEMSPVSRISKNGPKPPPTLLFVGGSDRRVPPEQSVEWKRLISEAHGNGIVTMRWYPDSGHAIDEVPCGDDVWVHTLELVGQL